MGGWRPAGEATEPEVVGMVAEPDAVGGECMVPRRSIYWEGLRVGEGMSAGGSRAALKTRSMLLGGFY